MKFARLVFLLATVFGVVVLTRGLLVGPGAGSVPPHTVGPVFYYGFLGVGLSWQIVFLLIWMDPRRYRPLMLAGALAKLSFFATCMVLLYARGLRPGITLYASFCDAAWAILFITSFAVLSTKASPVAETGSGSGRVDRQPSVG